MTSRDLSCYFTFCVSVLLYSLLFLSLSLPSALMLELQCVCQEAMVEKAEGEHRLERKTIELSALRSEYVTLMKSEGGLKEVNTFTNF